MEQNEKSQVQDNNSLEDISTNTENLNDNITNSTDFEKKDESLINNDNPEESIDIIELEDEEEPKKKKYVRLKNRTIENDIKYRGILSYRELRIIGWIAIAISQMGIFFRIGLKVDPTNAFFSGMGSFCSIFDGLSVPLFLCANFAFILLHRKQFKKIMLFYGGLSLLMFAIGEFVFNHYLFTFVKTLDSEVSYWKFSESIGMLMVNIGGPASYIFNIFIDLFLYTLVFFFLHYIPKKRFKGKKIAIFRLFTLIPIIYEVISIIIKYLALTNKIQLSFHFFLLLTAKSPFSFIAFLIIAGMMKIQSTSYLKRFKSKEQLDEYINSNSYSLRTSILMAVTFLVCVILDFFTLVIFSAIQASTMEGDGVENFELALNYGHMLGLGGSFSLLFMIPIVFLFSFNKRPKRPQYDKFVPLGGLALVAFTYVEGIFYLIINFLPYINELLQSLGSE